MNKTTITFNIGTSILTIVLLVSSPLSIYAHQGEQHSESKSKELSKQVENYSNSTLREIKENYKTKIEPLFKTSCFDCHGKTSSLPWYYSLPGVKGLMNSDMSEAKKHLDMRQGFPFKGHGTPKEDLVAIKRTIKKNSMPPLRYKIMHWSSMLSDRESRAIINWVDNSLKLLRDEKR